MAKLTPIKAIRAKCLECSYNQRDEVRFCPITDCALYEYRMGHRPKDNQDTSDTETAESEVSETIE